MKNIYYVISTFIIVLSVWILYKGALKSYGSSNVTVEFRGRIFGQALGFITLLFIAYPIWKWFSSKIFKISKRGVSFLCYSVLILFCSGYRSAKISNEVKQLKNFDIEVASILKNDPTINSNQDYSSKDFGDMAPLLKIVREVAEFSNQESIRFNRTMEEANLEKILFIENLLDYEALQSNLKALKLLEKEIHASQTRRIEHLAQVEIQIRSTLINPKLKNDFLEGYNRGKQKSMDLFNEFYQIELKLIKNMQSLLSFLIENQDSYIEENGKIAFYEEEDLQRFNTLMSNFFDLADEEERVQKRMEELTQSAIP